VRVAFGCGRGTCLGNVQGKGVLGAVRRCHLQANSRLINKLRGFGENGRWAWLGTEECWDQTMAKCIEAIIIQLSNKTL